jgi:hypothetical protein
LNFDFDLIKKLAKIASCKRVEGIPIDEGELTSMADVIREAARAQEKKDLLALKQSQESMSALTRDSL